ncbi:hypothetical protein AEQ67_13895 [Pseudomonas sp. RIT-PI-q]|uniref:hypothetical protein n=1 Tax=Pseudomonas sp. RIT-PI-q TaxID=1690247 RepID=UPI0006CC95FD|nr:hypothetical protein [Pseudomonas sp. RIT-PI-q]KPG98437.1 hypothetical protein AEQ67_13895 [Pseudomonas sp. RIT-PI-q]
MDHPLGGYGPALLVMFWGSRVLQKRFWTKQKAEFDSAKLTERLTLKVSTLAANNLLQKTDQRIKNTAALRCNKSMRNAVFL